MTRLVRPVPAYLPFILLLAALSGSVVAQPKKLDSLKSVVAGQPDDISKAKNLLEIARLYQSVNVDSLIYYSRITYELSRKVDFADGRIDPLFLISAAYRVKRDHDSAQFYNDQFLAIAVSLNDSVRLAKGYYAQAFIFIALTKYDQAHEYVRKSMSYFMGLKHHLGILACYNARAKLYERQMLLDSSVIYFHKAIEVAEANGERQSLSTIYDNLSAIYLELEQIDDAERITLMALEINEEYDRKLEMAANYESLAGCALLRNDYDRAMDFFEMAAAIMREQGLNARLITNYYNRGLIYQRQEKYDQAMDYFQNAFKGYMELGDNRGKMYTYGSLASIYSLTGQYEKAIILHDSCLLLARELDEPKYIMQTLGNISDTYKEAGNYQLAYEYLFQQYQYRDSIYTIEKERVINDLKLQYEQKKNQAQILELANANLEKDLSLRRRTNQRNAYFFMALAILALGFFVVLYYRQRSVKDRIIAAQKIRQLEDEKMLLAAKSLVEGQEEERKRIARDLHDGLGVLLSATKLQFTTLKDNNPENVAVIERATRLLEQASGDVRKISHNMMPGLLTRMGLYEAVEDLFENINDKGDLSAQCHIHDELPRLQENREIMLYRIIQELVNNTLKHARARNIMLDIRKSNGTIDLQYSDDGCGFDAGQVIGSTSMGLSSIRSRMNFLGGNVEIESQPGHGARFFITVPV